MSHINTINAARIKTIKDHARIAKMTPNALINTYRALVADKSRSKLETLRNREILSHLRVCYRTMLAANKRKSA